MPLLGVLMNSYKNTDVLLAGPVAKEDDLAILGGVLLLIFYIQEHIVGDILSLDLLSSRAMSDTWYRFAIAGIHR